MDAAVMNATAFCGNLPEYKIEKKKQVFQSFKTWKFILVVLWYKIKKNKTSRLKI